MADAQQIYTERASFSTMRMNELRNRIAALPAVKNFPNLTIFGAGSYARLEASPYSDIDMFFLRLGKPEELDQPRERQLRLFGELIQVIDLMNFPRFSNDCQYLTVMHTNDISSHLGGPLDDHSNFFTARMLLLLESKCLYGDETYHRIVSEMVQSYFIDYPDHSKTFQPIFLINDICRFWKTLLLNYENRRGLDDDTERKLKHKVKNFKLKFSRMCTCFAMISALGSHSAPVSIEQVIELVALTPRERLEVVAKRVPQAKDAVDDVLARYSWFLQQTGLPTDQLHDQFRDKTQVTELFARANEYGDAMYRLLQILDAAVVGNRNSVLRYLVI